MPLDDAVAFLQFVGEDAALQDYMNSASWGEEAVFEVAVARGYQFSLEELNAAMDMLWGALHDD